jgi:hypothetical protein
MQNYAYIFTIFSGCFAIIQIIRLIYPFAVKFYYKIINLKQIDKENLCIDTINKDNNIYLNILALILLLTLSVFVINEKMINNNKTLAIFELEKKLDGYYVELNKLKIEISKNMKKNAENYIYK